MISERNVFHVAQTNTHFPPCLRKCKVNLLLGKGPANNILYNLGDK